MDIKNLERNLLTAARANRPSEHVPYAFEKRIMARIQNIGLVDPWGLWSSLLWRAAGPCIALSLLLTIWSVLANGTSSLDLDLESTILAPMASLQDSW